MKTGRPKAMDSGRSPKWITNDDVDVLARRDRRENALALLLNTKHSVAEVARAVGVSRQTIYKWERSLKPSGTVGPDANAKVGRSPKLTDEQRAKLLDALKTKQSDKRRQPNLGSREYIRRYIEEEFKYSYTMNGITQLLKSLGINMKEVRGWQSPTSRVINTSASSDT